MKTILIFCGILFVSVWAKAQVTLEKSYSFSASASEIKSDEYVYFLMDVPQKQCRIFNTSHVLQKTINLSVPEGYYLSDIKFVSKNLFNNDDLIELLYIYEKYVSTTTWYYYQYGLGIVNENGTQLLNLSNGAFAEIKRISEENKLLAYTYIYNTLGYYDVTTNLYSLGGTADYTGFTSFKSEMVYPNPASDFLELNTSNMPEDFNGNFNLFSISGMKVLSEPLKTGERQEIKLDKIPAGMYVYSINERNKIIRSDKIIIR